MIQFDISSWHFRLVMYVFGENFFTEKDGIDYEKSDKTNSIVWNTKPKVVNFCPYCRAVLWGSLSLPFVFVWRLFPHKEKKFQTHAETMKKLNRRGNIIKSAGGTLQFPLALFRIADGDYIVAAIQITFGVMLILAFVSSPGQPPIIYKYLGPPIKKYLVPYIKIFVDYIAKHFFEKKQTSQKDVPPKDPTPNLLVTYFKTNHHKICPTIAFVDPNDTEVRI